MPRKQTCEIFFTKNVTVVNLFLCLLDIFRADKTVVRSSYYHNGISYTGDMASLYLISLQMDTYAVIDNFHICTIVCQYMFLLQWVWFVSNLNQNNHV